MGKSKLQKSKRVFIASSAIIFLLVITSAFYPKVTEQTFTELQGILIENASWFYVLSVAIFLIAVFFLLFSRYGQIKLGKDDSKPEYSNLTWFSMMFAAGMGIGLVFFSVAEPVKHFMHPPVGEPGTIAAAKQAMELTYFHWGLHAWGIYAIVGLMLAYFSYRRDLPLSLRSAFYPILKQKIYHWPGDLIDIFTIIATLFGVATSLGYGALQINTGLAIIFDLPNTVLSQITIIACITVIAITSVVSGINKGIKRLSQINLILAVSLMLLVFILGPTLFILKTFVQNTGTYLSSLVSKTFNLYAYQQTDWIGGWTLFYWSWWLSWSPFVGIFIARISKGRTIREFIVGVLFVPTLFTLAWMSIFGDSAIYFILFENAKSLAAQVDADVAVALFRFFEYFPFSTFISVIVIIVITIFFITSSDSGSLVIDMIASGGAENPETWQRFYWASIEGIVAISLLLLGGLLALQSATIASALPFTMILLVAVYGFFNSLKKEKLS